MVRQYLGQAALSGWSKQQRPTPAFAARPRDAPELPLV
ncbi:hypothetical protein ACPOL_2538 [Acidisarcina polymorpha]|uniref:Uncharacterized protein n=1 Tax=Acidisarcina polymorpha TaxID=2211140 RepID=A0A2Z5FYC7_9BACT|nr:hypothetical protein ACPOL_2538 [Acidisarcina polymorpha]